MNDLYDVELDWRPLDEQIKDVELEAKEKNHDPHNEPLDPMLKLIERNTQTLQTVEEEDEINYLSPSTSFDASKHSSKQSLHEMSKSSSGKSLPETVNENQPTKMPPYSDADEDGQIMIDVGVFEGKSASPEPTLDDTTASEETSKLPQTDSQNKEKIISSIPSELTSWKAAFTGRHRAKISGQHISKYSTPKLPKVKDDKNRSKFSFWSSDSLKGTVDNLDSVAKTKSKQTLSKGERVSTPYGLGFVVEHRAKSNIVVVDMTGLWKARAYLQESVVLRDSSGFFGNIFRQFSTGDKSPRKKSLKIEPEFPYAVGVGIQTPFGEGTVTRSLKNISSSASQTSLAEVRTVAISLNNWKLRDGSHPNLYCTADTAKEWKDKASTHPHKENSLFTVMGTLGTLVSGTVESLKKIRVTHVEAPPINTNVPQFERYYKDGAAVTTSYGDGVVFSFRSSDGFYLVKLIKFGSIPATAYLQDDSMSYRLAKGCVEGYPVLTKFGSGVLQSVNPTTGVHNVTIPSYGAVLYLQPDQVIRPLKAAVGEDVSTPYGEGKVLKYRLHDDMYEIKLSWGNSFLYATANTFDRIDDRMQDRGGFGMNWILQFFYSREEAKDEGPQRSRSNSFSRTSQSGVSVKSAR